jgi:hypothetical protein
MNPSGDRLDLTVPGTRDFRPACGDGYRPHRFEMGQDSYMDLTIQSRNGVSPLPGGSRAFTLVHTRPGSSQAWHVLMTQPSGSPNYLHHGYWRFQIGAPAVPIDQEIGDGSTSSPGNGGFWLRPFAPGVIGGRYQLYVNTGSVPDDVTATLTFDVRATVYHCP